jgi:hypothetical protein
LAGRNPDEHVKIQLAHEIPFDDVMWRYHDFLKRAEAAYHALTAPHLVPPPTRNRHHHSSSGDAHRSAASRTERKAGSSTS